MSKQTITDPLQALFAEAPSIDEEIEFKKLMIVEDILQLMKEQGINKKQFAKKMGVVPSRITSMLNGTNNMTIETLVKAAEAVGATLEQTIVPKGKKVKWVQYDEESTHQAFKRIKKRQVSAQFTNIEESATDTAYHYEPQPA